VLIIAAKGVVEHVPVTGKEEIARRLLTVVRDKMGN